MATLRESGPPGVRWRELPHGADRSIEVRGPDFPALVAGCVVALGRMAFGPEGLEARREEQTRVAPCDPEAMLFQVLAEVVFWMDARGWIPVAAEGLAEPDGGLTLRVACDVFDPARHRVRGMLKAPTLNGMRVRQGRRGWSVRVVVDT